MMQCIAGIHETGIHPSVTSSNRPSSSSRNVRRFCGFAGRRLPIGHTLESVARNARQGRFGGGIAEKSSDTTPTAASQHAAHAAATTQRAAHAATTKHSACTTTEEELVLAALVLEAAGVSRPGNDKQIVVPGDLTIQESLRTAGLWSIYERAGFRVDPPGCSMCLGVASRKAGRGEKWLSSQNRNFENRMGDGSLAHLSSAATVAASASQMKITDPRPLLAKIDQDRYRKILGARKPRRTPEVQIVEPSPHLGSAAAAPASAREARSAGTMPKTKPVRNETSSANPNTVPSSFGSTRFCTTSDGRNDHSNRQCSYPNTSPSTPLRTPSKTLSVRNCWMILLLSPPSAERMAISRSRADPRTNVRLAMLAQVINKTMPTAAIRPSAADPLAAYARAVPSTLARTGASLTAVTATVRLNGALRWLAAAPSSTRKVTVRGRTLGSSDVFR